MPWNRFQLLILMLSLIIMVGAGPLDARTPFFKLDSKYTSNTYHFFVSAVKEINDILYAYFAVFFHSAVVLWLYHMG